MTRLQAAATDAVTAAQHGRGASPAPGLRLCPAALASSCGTGPTRGRGIASESVTAVAATAAGLRLSDANCGQRVVPLAFGPARAPPRAGSRSPRPPSNRRVQLYNCTAVQLYRICTTVQNLYNCTTVRLCCTMVNLVINPNGSVRLDRGAGRGGGTAGDSAGCRTEGEGGGEVVS